MDLIRCARGIEYERNQSPGPNDHVAVIGASGRGKTTGYIDQNLIYGGDGSIILSDPKGVLYSRYASYFKENGYQVHCLDLIHPEKSEGFNPFSYLKTEADIQTFSRTLVYRKEDLDCTNRDPYWDISSKFLLESLIQYMLWEEKKHDFRTLTTLLVKSRDFSTARKIEDAATKYPKNSLYRKFHSYAISPDKTKGSTYLTAYAKLESLDVKEIMEITERKPIDIRKIGKEKTIVFVCVPDVDRSRDTLANIFFTICLQELCALADEQPDGKLPIDTRIIMDDFANSIIPMGFPVYISNLRSRGIGIHILLQSFAQLEAAFDKDARTILDNCDTQIYMGGNNVETAEMVAKRCNLPVKTVLELPYGACLIMRTGQSVTFGKIFEPLEAYYELER